jgi:hypothetical protein
MLCFNELSVTANFLAVFYLCSALGAEKSNFAAGL